MEGKGSVVDGAPLPGIFVTELNDEVHGVRETCQLSLFSLSALDLFSGLRPSLATSSGFTQNYISGLLDPEM